MELIADLGNRPRKNPARHDRWGLFRCHHCGSVVERIKRNGLRDLSCGCARYELSGDSNSTHGYTRNGSKHPLYAICHAIIQRCTDPNVDSYERYGGRGITVCAEWKTNRASFVEWALANGYRPGLQIDRIDNNAGYSPENCRFVDSSTNCRNRRSTVLNSSIVRAMRADYDTGQYSKAEIAKKYCISDSHTCRILRGQSW